MNENLGDKCIVTVDFRIYSILDISEANSYVELAFELTLSWADPRLLFYNLKDQIDLNVLTQEEKSRVWMPVLIFENTRDKSSTIEDEKRKGFVKKMGTSKYAEMDESNVNKEIFEGAENDVRKESTTCSSSATSNSGCIRSISKSAWLEYPSTAHKYYSLRWHWEASFIKVQSIYNNTL